MLTACICIMQIQKFDIRCPRWALPREDVPIHVKMDKNVTPSIRRVVISWPDCLKIKDIINVSKYNIQNGKMAINSIEKAEGSSFDYFGLVVATTDPFDELRRQVPLNIVFWYVNGTSEEHTVPIRVFRPRLEFEQVPNEIILAKNKDPMLPINLKFSGFGDIVVRAECTIKGKLVSVGDSLLDLTVRRFYDEFANNTSTDDTFATDKENVYRITRDLRNLIKTTDNKVLNKEIIELTNSLDAKEREHFMNIFYDTIEGYLLKTLSDFIKQNVGSRTRLESETKIYTEITLPITEVALRFIYKDLVGNEYSTCTKRIKIKSNIHGSFDVEIPVIIKRVNENEAYTNVSNMNWNQ